MSVPVWIAVASWAFSALTLGLAIWHIRRLTKTARTVVAERDLYRHWFGVQVDAYANHNRRGDRT